MRDWLQVEVLGKIKSGHIVATALVGLFLLVAALWQWPDNRLHLIFCDVGQGDAILVSRGSAQILIDGGPNDKVLGCLSRHLPFWDRTVEMVVATHPDFDHIGGLHSVLDRYSVRYIVSGPESSDEADYKELVRLVAEKSKAGDISVRNISAGDRVSVGKIEGLVVWPDRVWLEGVLGAVNASSPEILSDSNKVQGYEDKSDKSVKGMVFDGGAVLGVATKRELNDFSLVVEILDGNFTALLMGDLSGNMDEALLKTGLVPKVNVLKYPHHGSKTGATQELLEGTRPDLAIISAGRGNRYGHPAPETLDLLRLLNIPFRRTDELGDIEIVSDGMRWWTK
jgi:competence protein ComEC